MSDYSELIRSLKAAAGGFADIAKDLAGGAGEKAKALAKLAKLTMELSTERDSLKDAYAEVGKLYFETADKTAPGEMYVRAFDIMIVVPTLPFSFPSSFRDCTVILTLVAVIMTPINTAS